MRSPFWGPGPLARVVSSSRGYAAVFGLVAPGRFGHHDDSEGMSTPTVTRAGFPLSRPPSVLGLPGRSVGRVGVTMPLSITVTVTVASVLVF